MLQAFFDCPLFDPRCTTATRALPPIRQKRNPFLERMDPVSCSTAFGMFGPHMPVEVIASGYALDVILTGLLRTVEKLAR